MEKREKGKEGHNERPAMNAHAVAPTEFDGGGHQPLYICYLSLLLGKLLVRHVPAFITHPNTHTQREFNVFSRDPR